MKKSLKHSVLIVDDDPDDRESIRDAFLENEHHHDFTLLHDANHLMEHLTAAIKKHPALILLDLNMPGKDGRELLKELKANKAFQPIPIIVFTTSSSETDRMTSYELGANCFITKPHKYTDLMEITDSIARLWFIN